MGRYRRVTRNLLVAVMIAVLMVAILPSGMLQAKTRKTSVKSPSKGNVFVVFKGTFKTDERQKALDRMNEIRLEACKEGVINPSTGKKLTEKDYVPLKWSSDLEMIAQTRAVEGDVLWDHTRPNGERCFTVKYNGTQSQSEVLAWNYNENMVYGVNQWYEEKADWVNKNSGAVTGHYTSMIDPKNIYVGLGAFMVEGENYICISGEFSTKSGLKEDFVGVSGKYSQVVEIPADKLNITLKGATIKTGKTKKLSPKLGYKNEDSWLSGEYIKCSVYGKVKWSSSDKNIATVSKKGKVKGKSNGTVTITAKTSYGLKATCEVTVKGKDSSSEKEKDTDNRDVTDKINAGVYTIGSGNYKIELSGKKEEHFITDRLCYTEGKHCFILLDKDVDLPGDFVKNVDLIMETLEKEIGLKFTDSNLEYDYGGYAPWDNIDFGKKIPIYIFTDRNDYAYVSYALPTYVVIRMNELISQEVWDSVPTYKNDPWRRDDYISYGTIAHELTHVLTLRYATLSEMMTEGSADYFAHKTLETLAGKDTEFAKCLEKEVVFYSIEKTVTKDNMESIFVDDFAELGMMDRTDKYTLGRIFCEYIADSYGDNFMHDYIIALADAGHRPGKVNYGYLDNKMMEKQASIIKKLFGKKIFEDFGEIYHKNYYYG